MPYRTHNYFNTLIYFVLIKGNSVHFSWKDLVHVTWTTKISFLKMLGFLREPVVQSVTHFLFMSHIYIILLSLCQESFFLIAQSLWILFLACLMGKWQPSSQGHERPWQPGWANDSFCKTFFQQNSNFRSTAQRK